MYEQEGYNLFGAAFEVYNQLGNGMAEEVYQQYLEIELKLRGIACESKQLIGLAYKGHAIEKTYTRDLFVFNAIVVELKACKELAPDHEAQLFNYMRLARQPIGYLLNFGAKGGLQWKRYVVTDLKL